MTLRPWREGASELPLYGIPVAINDNFDLADLPTTAACPRYAYAPGRDAKVVERLKRAGAPSSSARPILINLPPASLARALRTA